MSKPVVWVLGTGGTIASKYDAKLGGHVAAASAEEMIAAIPALTEHAEIRAVEHSKINSAGIDTATVFGLRDRLVEVLADPAVAGAVITHGTATLEETAYMMDLLINSPKPVVVTGAQRNFDVKDADGPRNIVNAVRVAADPASTGRGVMVAVGGEIHAARDVIKSHTYRLNAFSSRDSGKIGEVNEDCVIYFTRPERRLYFAVDHVKDNVQYVVMTQGSNDLLLRACIAGKADGIVVDGVGGGTMNVPFYQAICDALDAGIPVVITSRHLGGQPHISKGYIGSLKSVMEHGAISGGYLTGIKARILLMVVLAKTKDRKELADIFARA